MHRYIDEGDEDMDRPNDETFGDVDLSGKAFSGTTFNAFGSAPAEQKAGAGK